MSADVAKYDPVAAILLPDGTPIRGDWWGATYVHAFYSLSLVDGYVERREQVWTKRVLRDQKRDALYPVLQQLCAEKPWTAADVDRFLAQASGNLSMVEKRRVIYDLAQMCKAKGQVREAEYERILAMADALRVEDTVADRIINSVANINDTFSLIVGLLALGVILYTTRMVIVPLVIAMFLSMVIGKANDRVGRLFHITRFRWLQKVGTLTVVMGLLTMLFLLTLESSKEVVDRLPFYIDKLLESWQSIRQWLAGYGIRLRGIAEWKASIQEPMIASALGNMTASVAGWLGNSVLVGIFTGFLTLSKASTDNGLLQEMNEKVSGYIAVQTATSALTGIAVGLLCWAFGVDFALFWGILMFLLNFIPNVGATIATIPVILLALVQLDNIVMAILFIAILVCGQMVMGNVVEPRLMGNRLALKPLAILLGLIFWGFLWGIAGMFLAVPLMVGIRILASYFNFSRGFERLLRAD